MHRETSKTSTAIRAAFGLAIRIVQFESLRTGGDSNRCEPRAAIQDIQRFHASFFPFCPLCWLPLFLPFSGRLLALVFPRKVLCSVECRAQHTAWRGPCLPSESALFCGVQGTAHSLERGSFRMDLSTKFGKEVPSRNLRQNKVRDHLCTN